MATTYPVNPTTPHPPATESEVVHSCWSMLKYVYGLLPIVTGADKFTNFIANWEEYLNPRLAQMVNLSPHTFMLIVGVIEIVAGICVFLKPRFGGMLVMFWLLAIALQLVFEGRYLDVAVRDIAMAFGALTLVRLTPHARAYEYTRK